MDRNDAIAWAVATGVWVLVLALLLWLASRERRGVGPWLRWLGPRVAGGLALWVAVFGATRWAERKISPPPESHSRAVRSEPRMVRDGILATTLPRWSSRFKRFSSPSRTEP